MARSRLAFLAVAAVLFSACTAITGLGDYEIVDVDAGLDAARADVAVAEKDGAVVVPSPIVEAGEEGGDATEPVPEAGVDASVDATAPKDATTTDAAIVDAQTDGRTGEPGIHCGSLSCNFRCCAGFASGFTCKASGASCITGLEGAFDCDDGLDCGPGTSCCVNEQSGLIVSAKCQTSCGSTEEMACTLDSQCPPGKRCLGKSSLALTELKTCR